MHSRQAKGISENEAEFREINSLNSKQINLCQPMKDCRNKRLDRYGHADWSIVLAVYFQNELY